MAAFCGSSNLSLSGVSIRKENDNQIFHEVIFPPFTFERICNITPEKQLQYSSPVFLDPDTYRVRIQLGLRIRSGKIKNYPQ